MISKFFYVIGFAFIYSKIYIGIQPLHQKCIRIDIFYCEERNYNMKFDQDKTTIYSLEFIISKYEKNLKHIIGCHSLIDFDDNDDNAIKITELSFYTKQYDRIGTLYKVKIDDKFNFFDYYTKIITSFRIKIFDKNELLINFISISYSLKSLSEEYSTRPTEHWSESIKKIYYWTSHGIYQGFDPFSYQKYYCELKAGYICQDFFLNLFPFKHENNASIVIKEDSILSKYLLEGVIRKDLLEHKITYKYQIDKIENSDDQNVDEETTIEPQNENFLKCMGIEINGIHEIQCKCKNGFYGVNCSNKIRNFKFDCEALQMCGSNGLCKKDIGKNECICRLGYVGKYCTKRFSIGIDSKSVSLLRISIVAAFGIIIIVGIILIAYKSKII